MSASAAGVSTPSLRLRTTAAVLVVVAFMLVGLAVVTDLVLADRLNGQLRQRLTDRASVAAVLVDKVDARDLARRLEGDGVSVVVTDADGQVYAEGPLAGRYAADSTSSTGAGSPAEPPQTKAGPAGPPAPKGTARVVRTGQLLTVSRSLPGGGRVLLVADSGDVGRTLNQVRLAFALAAVAALLVAGAVIPLVVGRALAPLRAITDVARTIGRGDRARRLDPTRPGSDLGRTAQAFDEMLDDVTGAEQQAQQSEERLRAFLSDAAHELRTPLTGVLASAEHVLRHDPDRIDREQALLTLIREAQRATRLVDDLLLMARIDRGLELDPEPIDLRAHVLQVLDSRRHVVGSAAISVEGEAVIVYADRDRLMQVIVNLVENAVRYGRGPISLRTSAEEGVGVLDVVDEGPGVPPADQERIFDRMVRLDASRTRDRTGVGSGLGLPIARGIAMAHGGTLTYVPRPAGAHFRLTLPLSAAPLATSSLGMDARTTPLPSA